MNGTFTDVAGRTDTPVDQCGSEPPLLIIDRDGRQWLAGDCWCTLTPDHDGLCYCEPCTIRLGAPGWEAT